MAASDLHRDLVLELKQARLGSRIFVDELRIDTHACLVICGPNGGGKSSLLRLIAGLNRPSEGQVTLGGRALDTYSRRQLAAAVAWLPQRADIAEPLTVEALVASSRFRFFESNEEALHQARILLERQGLASLACRLSSQISGGELQRVLITSLLAQEAPILLVDEPANHLDPKHQVEAYRNLGQLWKDGRSLVVVSHDVRLAQLLGPYDKIRIVGIKNGKIALSTTLSDPDIAQHLTTLYGVPYVSPGSAGCLSVDLGQHAEALEDDTLSNEGATP